MSAEKSNSKAVIVTPEMPTNTGGVGVFTWHFAKLLKSNGHDVLIVVAHPTPATTAAAWSKLYAETGIAIATIDSETFNVPNGSNSFKQIAQSATDLIPEDADVVYLAEWLANGIDFVRKLRFQRQPGPAVVTVLHGCSQWVREGMRTFPVAEHELYLDAAEAYSAQHSDFVVAPGKYMLSWVKDAGWALPDGDRLRIMHLPFFPTTPQVGSATSTRANASERAQFRRIVFFGRLETRKGIELFVNGLMRLQGRPCLNSIDEIVLLGNASVNALGTPDTIVKELATRLQHTTSVRAITTLNTFQAQAYLAEHASDSLVVMPSLRENFPLAVIEASLIPGLNLIASDTGSIAEILGPNGHDHVFEPFLSPFVKRLEETLLAGPKPADELGQYDWQHANDVWMAFHDEATAFARARRLAAGERTSAASVDRSVDVCIPYYNLGPYLPYMLQSLEQQTSQDFTVIVVNDGSTDPLSIKVFEEQAARYESRGWKFITTGNSGPCAARNAAAAAGTGRYLIFIDADDVAAPTLVERFRDAVEISEDDCLSSYLRLFQGEGWDETYTKSTLHLYMPSGPHPALGLVSNPFGGACFIVTRKAFDGINGFSTDVSRYVGFEDYEFLLRLMLEGYRLDVIPEFLLYYRVRDDGNFRSGDQYENQLRIMHAYERKLQHAGFPGLAALAVGGYETNLSQRVAVSSDVSSLVYHVSGHVLWKALRIKLRNQIAKRLGRPLIDR